MTAAVLIVGVLLAALLGLVVVLLLRLSRAASATPATVGTVGTVGDQPRRPVPGRAAEQVAAAPLPDQVQDEIAQLLAAARREAEQLGAAARSDAAATRGQAEREGAERRARADAEARDRAERAAAEIADAREAAAAARASAAEAAAGAAALRVELAAREERLAARHDRLTEREARVAAEAAAAATRRDAEQAAHAQAEVELVRDRATLREELAGWAEQRKGELERVAALTAQDAKAELVAALEHQAKREAAVLIRDLETQTRRDADRRAREVVSQAIARVAGEQTTESVVSVLHLPAEEMKGRIIGREGRNIRTFETVTGVNVLIDDTPGAVALSCFDPVRRETARVTLAALIADGRIHPQRIEESYLRAQAEVEASVQRAGEDALVEVGIDDLHPDLVAVLGRLRYRTSYGQNVLRHLVETAQIAAGMAAEIGLGRAGVGIVKRAAFLHDIGKALTHEVEGSHALVGADLARRHGESEDVVHAIGAHHLEVAPATVEAWLTIGSDSCSGGRPGARRESLESYVERLTRIEEIAKGRHGVEKVYAMSAGRELRVMVLPDEIDDLGAQVLARDIAAQIQDELTYPGQIRVTVVRESRATETAH